MKTQYYTACSLDGFIATTDDSLEWLFPLGDINDTSYPAFIRDVGALAMGSATYLWMVRNVIKPGSDTPGAWPYAQPTWVFTGRVLPGIAGADIRFVKGSVRPVHAQMRTAAEGKNMWVVGGGDLAGQFHELRRASWCAAFLRCAITTVLPWRTEHALSPREKSASKPWSKEA